MPASRRRFPAFAAATTSGVVIGLIIQILLAKRGIDLAAAWHDAATNDGMQLRSALVWWTIAGVTFVASFVIAAVIDRVRWTYLRVMRWALGVAGVYFLAVIGHAAASPPGIAAGAHLAASLAAFAVALLMAAFGAYFAVRS